MNTTLRCLVGDLKELTVQDCSEIDAIDANILFTALMTAVVTVDCAMVIKGNFDWKDERSQRLSGRTSV